MLTDFKNSFTDRFTSKFAVKLSLTIPPHFKCVATLPCETCEILMSENLTTIRKMHCYE